MLYFINEISDLPNNTIYREVGRHAIWDNRLIIQSSNLLDFDLVPDELHGYLGLEGWEAPYETYTSIDYIPTTEIKETAVKMAEFATQYPLETLGALLDTTPIDSAVNLYNADGVKRVEKVVNNG